MQDKRSEIDEKLSRLTDVNWLDAIELWKSENCQEIDNFSRVSVEITRKFFRDRIEKLLKS